jgi:hypothetical protein
MGKVFKSKFTRGGSVLRPDVIEVTDTRLIYTKRDSNLISKDEKSISIVDIVEISIDNHLIGADLLLKTRGMGRIKIESFDKNDIKEIKKLVEQNQERIKSQNLPKTSSPVEKKVVVEKIIEKIVEKESKSKEIQIEEFRQKEELRKEKLLAKKYVDINQIPHITLNENNVLEELQKLITSYKLKIKSNSQEIYELEHLYLVYNEKIEEGLRILDKSEKFKNDISFFKNEYENLKESSKIKLTDLKNRQVIKDELLNRKKKKNNYIKYGLIGVISLFVIYLIFSPSKKEASTSIKLLVIKNEKQNNLSEFIQLNSDSTVLETKVHDELPLSFNIIKKYPKDLKSYKIESNLKFYDKDTVYISNFKDFEIKYDSKDKLAEFLKKGEGKLTLMYDGYLLPDEVEFIRNNVKFVQIDFNYEK